jgi:hypothetical protein
MGLEEVMMHLHRVVLTCLALSVCGCTVYAPAAEDPTSVPPPERSTHREPSYSPPPTTYSAYHAGPPPAHSPTGPGSSTSDDEIQSDCTYKGVKLAGNVKFVDAFPDFEIKIVDAFPDLNVKLVDAFPDECGKWKVVDAFPDFTVKVVDAFSDFDVRYVDAFPGLP